MTFDITFEESNQSFDAHFGEVHDISDGGFERGYEAGKADGKVEGYADGKIDGIEQGRAEGESAGYKRGLGEGIEQGKKSQYDEFWDKYQDYGNRRDYMYGAFGGIGWTDETYKPKYQVKIKNSYQCFVGCNMTEILNVDTSEAVELNATFYVCPKLLHVGVLSFESASGSISSTFKQSRKLHTIDKLILNERIIYNQMFQECNALQNITIEGTIGQNGFDIHWSAKLSKASIESIVNALSTSTSGLSITLSKTAVNNAFTTEEWNALVATKSNWTISLA
jgi:hypothetical protein